MTACKVTFEDPPGMGFGEALLQLSRLYRMKTKTVEGRPVGGATVTLSVHFTNKDL